MFITVGIMYIAFGVFGKFGAFFITIPYSVLGGVTIISFGIFIGVNLSNMIYIDLHSTRNLSIIGISMLLGLMIPYWTQENPDGIKTGKHTGEINFRDVPIFVFSVDTIALKFTCQQ